MSYIETVGKILDTNDLEVAGGASSAISGAMAASIAAMVSRLSMKKDYGLSTQELEEIIREAEPLSKKLQEGADRDVEAFHSIMEAIAMPKSTDEEKERRKDALQAGYIFAASVPRENAYDSVRAKELLEKLIGRSNPNCFSDLAVARTLADVAINGCMLNIRANVDTIRDEVVKEKLNQDIAFLKTKISLIDAGQLLKDAE